MKPHKVLAVVGAVVLLFAATDAATYAATGSSLVLGRINQANATTTIRNTGTTPVLKLLTKSTATAPMVVNGKGKVTNLYADRAATADNSTKLAGLTVAQIKTAAKGSTGATGPAGPRGATGNSGAQFGRQVVLVTTVDPTADVGWYSSITIGGDGLPVVSYTDSTSGRLKFAHCSDVVCATSTSTLVWGSPTTGYHTSITVGPDGSPIISYYDVSNQDLNVTFCGSNCVGKTLPKVIDSAGDVGVSTSITIGTDGLAIIGYADATNHSLKVAHCTSAYCSTSTTGTIDSSGDVGNFTSITIGTDGLPIISYYDNGNHDLKVAHCTDVACTTATTSSIDTVGDVGYHTSIAIGTDGLPVISYTDYTDTVQAKLKVAHCTNTACTSATTSTVDAAGNVGYYTSMAIGGDGLPVISYTDYSIAGDADLKVAYCANTACTAATTRTVDSQGDVGYYTSIAIGTDGQPIISYYDNTYHVLRVAHISHTAWSPHGWGR
jgi:hypothetical protein